MFILRRLGLAFGLLAAAIFSQLPEFAQQYRQRLGGAVDEIARMLADFDLDAANNRMTRDQAVDALRNNPDNLVSQRGVRLRQSEERVRRLDEQLKAFQSAGSFGRLVVLARDYDSGIAARAWNVFEPAMPLTIEGFTAAAAGFFGALGLWRLMLWPMNRRRRVVLRRPRGAEP